MKNLKLCKVVCALVMALVTSNIPNLALAGGITGARSEMISARAVLTEITRAEAEHDIRAYLQKTQVRGELVKQGIAPDEVSDRLASLSEQEIQQLASQVREARAGGEILMAILIVVLIVYLVQRI